MRYAFMVLSLVFFSTSAQANCGFIRDPDQRNLCYGHCGFIRDADLRNYCSRQCGFIRENDLRQRCLAEKRRGG